MVIGVSSFSFVSGALSSIMSNYDQRQADLQEKVLQLNRLKQVYGISDMLYFDIKTALKYDSQR